MQEVWEEVLALREQLAQAQAVMQRQEDQLSQAVGTAQAAQLMAQQADQALCTCTVPASLPVQRIAGSCECMQTHSPFEVSTMQVLEVHSGIALLHCKHISCSPGPAEQAADVRANGGADSAPLCSC